MVVYTPRDMPLEELMELQGVYTFTFFEPNAVYVGSTSRSFNERFSEHMDRLEANTHPCHALQRRFNEGGGRMFFGISSVVMGQKDILIEEAACLKIYAEIFPGSCEILNNPKDAVWQRAREITFRPNEEDAL